MATYVLVHGSNQGGWIWQPVANLLRAAGHQVYAPSLDGCGERKSQMRPGINKVVPVVEAVTAVGAYYSSSMSAFDDYSVTSGRVVTGTNPQSARSAAERAVKLFSTL